MNLSLELRALARKIDEIGSCVDEEWKESERAAIALAGPRADEQEAQKLGAISVMLWEAYRQIVKRGIPAADQLAAKAKGKT